MSIFTSVNGVQKEIKAPISRAYDKNLLSRLYARIDGVNKTLFDTLTASDISYVEFCTSDTGNSWQTCSKETGTVVHGPTNSSNLLSSYSGKCQITLSGGTAQLNVLSGYHVVISLVAYLVLKDGSRIMIGSLDDLGSILQVNGQFTYGHGSSVVSSNRVYSPFVHVRNTSHDLTSVETFGMTGNVGSAATIPINNAPNTNYPVVQLNVANYGFNNVYAQVSWPYAIWKGTTVNLNFINLMT